MARNMLATLLLLFLVDSSFSTAPNCALQKPYDHIANTDTTDAPDCNKYYICASQKARPMPYTCPDGYRFSKETKSCTWKEDVPCGGNTPTSGDCKEAGQKLNDPANDKTACNKYFECSLVNAVLTKSAASVACPADQIFSPIEADCVPENEWYCDQVEGPDCDDIKYDGMFLPVADDEAAYYICNDGVRIKSRCDATKYRFDVASQSCAYKKASTTPVPADDQPDISHICKGQTVPFVADPNVCTGYFYCMDENTAIWDTCPPDQYFYNGFCTKTKPPTCSCEGITWDTTNPTKKVLKEHADKSKYYVCVMDKRPVVKSCPGGFVFSLAEKSCVSK